jgi:hypothetical protein
MVLLPMNVGSMPTYRIVCVTILSVSVVERGSG